MDITVYTVACRRALGFVYCDFVIHGEIELRVYQSTEVRGVYRNWYHRYNIMVLSCFYREGSRVNC